MSGAAWCRRAAVAAIAAAAIAACRPSLEGRASPGPDGVQVAELVVAGGEYAPRVLHARAGQPLRLRVRVRDRHACATRLHVPDLHATVELRAGEVVEQVLPAAPAGAYPFTCDMRMIRGVVVYE